MRNKPVKRFSFDKLVDKKGGNQLSRMIINRDRCKACECCIRECPKHAISLTTEEFNKKGYRYVTINEEKCVKCGICYHMCPDCVFELEV